MSGRMARQKGKRGEQEVAAMLRDVFPDVRTKRAGGESATQDRGRDLLGTPGLCVQSKCMARPNPLKALLEAAVAATGHEIPVAFCKQSRMGRGNSTAWTVTLLAEDFIGLWAASQANLAAVAGPKDQPLEDAGNGLA